MYNFESFEAYVENLRIRVLAEKGPNTSTAEVQYYVAATLYTDHRASPSQQYLDEAIRQLRCAAEQGHAGAQHGLGKIFHEETSVKNEIQAKKWFTSAAEQGYAESQWMMGRILNDEGGSQENKSEAIRWLRLAAAQGHADAKLVLEYETLQTVSVLRRELKNDDGLPENGERLREYAYEKFKKELPTCTSEAEIEYQAGVYLYTLNRSPEYLVQAAKLFTLAMGRDTVRGHDEAQYMLGKMYAKGIVSKGDRQRDQEEAVRLFGTSAAFGHERSKNAIMYIAFLQKQEKEKEGSVIEDKALETWLTKLVLEDDVDAIHEAHEIGVNFNTLFGNSLVHQAVERGSAEVIGALKAGGANVDALDERGRPPLYVAIRGGFERVVVALKLAGANMKVMCHDATMIMAAASEKKPRLIGILVAAGVDVNQPDTQGFTPLMAAVHEGDVEVTIALLKAKADPNFKTKQSTALAQAAAKANRSDGHAKINELLKEHSLKLQREVLEKNRNLSTTQPQQKGEKKSDKEAQVIAPTDGSKRRDKKDNQEKKPEDSQVKRSVQEEPHKKETISPKTLFSGALKEKEAAVEALAKTHSATNNCLSEKEKLKPEIFKKIAASRKVICETRLVGRKDKSRLLKLEQNLRTLKEVEKLDKEIAEQKKIVSKLITGFCGLLHNLQTALDLKPEQRPQPSTNTRSQENSESNFTWAEFLNQLITLGEKLEGSKFKQALDVLQEQWAVIIRANEALSELMYALRRYNTVVLVAQAEVWSELVRDFAVTGRSDGSSQPDTDPQIAEASNAIIRKLEALGYVAPEEKTAQDHVRQQFQQAPGSQRPSNDDHVRGRRTSPQGQRPTDIEPQADNEASSTKKLSKAQLRRADEARVAAKAAWLVARIVAHKQEEKDIKEAKISKEREAAIACEREEISTGRRKLRALACETKVPQEEKTAMENLLFKINRINVYNEVAKLEQIIQVVIKRKKWSSLESSYAILQAFSYLNDVVKQREQHSHHATREVAECFRDTGFHAHQQVRGIVENSKNWPGIVNAWSTFLETAEMDPNANEGQVLDKIGSTLLTKIYLLGKGLSKEKIDIDKSCANFAALMRFGHKQRYGTSCSIRLTLGRIEKFKSSIEAGHEIVITVDENTFRVYYKNKNSCQMTSFLCDEKQRQLIAKLKLDDATLVSSASDDAEEVYKQIYAAVASREGCTRFGDDIIGREAARYYWAITGTERGTLEQARKEGNDRARKLLAQFAQLNPSVSREEHLRRGKEARHFEPSVFCEEHLRREEEAGHVEVLEVEDTKTANEPANIFGNLLFRRPLNLHANSFGCMLDTNNDDLESSGNGQCPGLFPVSPTLTFAFPSYCMREREFDNQSQCLVEILPPLEPESDLDEPVVENGSPRQQTQ